MPPPLRYTLISLPPLQPLGENGKNRRELILRFTKKGYIAWLFEPTLYWHFCLKLSQFFLTILGLWPSPLLVGRLLGCKKAAYFMWRGGTKANDVNNTDSSFIVSTKCRALFFNNIKSCLFFWQNPSLLGGGGTPASPTFSHKANCTLFPKDW